MRSFSYILDPTGFNTMVLMEFGPHGAERGPILVVELDGQM